ncbi:MAG: hypothetical protein QM688_11005 [Sphingomonas bacterium]
MRGPGAARLLERALLKSASEAGAAIVLTHHRATEWHSATFSGLHHEIMGETAGGGGFCRWLEKLPEADLPLPGHLVADIAVVAIERGATGIGFTLEALTVEES